MVTDTMSGKRNVSAARHRELAPAYSRPLSMEEAFDRVMQLEREHADERAERQRIERQLEEERVARDTLEREINGRLRGIEITASSASGWKDEVAALREEKNIVCAAHVTRVVEADEELQALLAGTNTGLVSLGLDIPWCSDGASR